MVLRFWIHKKLWLSLYCALARVLTVLQVLHKTHKYGPVLLDTEETVADDV